VDKEDIQTKSDDIFLEDVKKLITAGDFSSAISKLLLELTSNSNNIELLYLLSVSYRYNKNYSKAIESLNSLFALNPEHSRALQEMGHTYRAMGDYNRALEAYHRATRLNSALTASLNAQIKILGQVGQDQQIKPLKAQLDYIQSLPKPLIAVIDLLAQGKLVKAEQICKLFLQKNPRNVEGMRLLSQIALKLGVLDDAEFLLESALEFSPNNSRIRIEYIQVLRKRQNYAGALHQAKVLLEMDKENPQFQSVFAIEAMQSGDFENALIVFDKILEKIPEDPVTLTSRGHLLKTCGEREKAIDSYRRAIKKYPGHGEAYFSLSNLKLFKFSDEDIALMEDQEGSDRVGHMSKIYLNFALGKAYEDKNLFDKAFSYYERGNKNKRIQSRYVSDDLTKEFQAQKKVFTNDFVEKNSDNGFLAADPIFIVGLPRAGSTLLEQILASHSQVDGTMELPNILSLAQKLRRGERLSSKNHYPEVITKLSSKTLREFGETYIKETRIHRGKAPFFIDKMPNNFRHIGLIHMILPNAKIIDARRHPMACCFSGFKQLFAEGQEFTYGLKEIGTYYKDYVELMDHWECVFPGKVHRVQYEELVTNFEPMVQRLLDFCGLEFEQSCVEFYKSDRSVRTPSSEQVRQPIYKSGMDQWRGFEAHLGPLKEALGDVLLRYPI
tara:strand:+ start:300 stop:2306 length:2007 start_codon:yes stop_codon:yes gene_type:complete